FTPDGRSLAFTRSGDGAIVVWDLAQKRDAHVLRGHTGFVHELAVSPDGRLLASASGDGTVRLWDLATGDELAQLVPMPGRADWLVCTPDGLFDGSAGGRDKVAYRVGRGLNVVPVD